MPPYTHSVGSSVYHQHMSAAAHGRHQALERSLPASVLYRDVGVVLDCCTISLASPYSATSAPTCDIPAERAVIGATTGVGVGAASMSVSDISTVPHQSTALDQIDNSCLLHRPRLLRQQARLCQPTLLNTRTLPPSYLLKSHSTSSVPLQRPESPTSIQGDDDDAEDGRCNYDDNDDNYENQEPSNVPLQVSARHHGNVAASMNTASGFRASTGAGAGLRRRSVHSTALSSSVLASPVLCRRIPVRSPYDSSELDILMDHTLLRSSTTLGPYSNGLYSHANISVNCNTSQRSDSKQSPTCLASPLPLQSAKDMYELDTDDYGGPLVDGEGDSEADSFMSTDDDAETAVNDISMASIYLDKSFISTSTESTAHESTFASLVGDDLDADYDNDMEEGDCHYSGNLLPRAFQSLCETSSVLVDSFPPTTQSDSIQPPSLTDLSSSFDSLFDSLGWSGLSETMPDIDDSDFALSSPSAYADIHHDLDDVETFGSHNLSMGDQHNYMGVEYDHVAKSPSLEDAGEDPIHEHELPNSLLHSKYHRLDQQLYQRRQYRSRRRNEKLYRHVDTGGATHLGVQLDTGGDREALGLRAIRRRYLQGTQIYQQHHSWTVTVGTLPTEVQGDQDLSVSDKDTMLAVDNASNEAEFLDSPWSSMFSESDASDCTLASDAPSSLSGRAFMDISYVPPWYQPLEKPSVLPCSLCAICARTPHLAASFCCQRVGQRVFNELVAAGSTTSAPRPYTTLSDSYPNAATVVVATAPTHSLSPSPPCPELQFSSPTSLAATISPDLCAARTDDDLPNSNTHSHMMSGQFGCQPHNVPAVAVSLPNRVLAPLSLEAVLSYLLPSPAELSNNKWLPFSHEQLYNHIQPYIPNVTFPAAYSHFNYIDRAEVNSWVQEPDSVDKIRYDGPKTVSWNSHEHSYTQRSGN